MQYVSYFLFSPRRHKSREATSVPILSHNWTLESFAGHQPRVTDVHLSVTFRHTINSTANWPDCPRGAVIETYAANRHNIAGKDRSSDRANSDGQCRNIIGIGLVALVIQCRLHMFVLLFVFAKLGLTYCWKLSTKHTSSLCLAGTKSTKTVGWQICPDIAPQNFLKGGVARSHITP